MTRERHLSNRWFATGAASGLFAGYVFASPMTPTLEWTFYTILLMWSVCAAVWWWMRRAPEAPKPLTE